MEYLYARTQAIYGEPRENVPETVHYTRGNAPIAIGQKPVKGVMVQAVPISGKTEKLFRRGQGHYMAKELVHVGTYARAVRRNGCYIKAYTHSFGNPSWMGADGKNISMPATLNRGDRRTPLSGMGPTLPLLQFLHHGVFSPPEVVMKAAVFLIK
jgi:hypothetical protein